MMLHPKVARKITWLPQTKARLSRKGAIGLCGLACITAIAGIGLSGAHRDFAQSAQAAAQANSAQANSVQVDGARPPAPQPQAKPSASVPDASVSAAPDPLIHSPKQQIAIDSANLLKLATSLKAEVDKSDRNMLSVPVVRDAGAIEQLAHRMRGQ